MRSSNYDVLVHTVATKGPGMGARASAVGQEEGERRNKIVDRPTFFWG